MIKTGDIVTWRQGKSRLGIKAMPLGIANCKVLDVGETATGAAAAMLRLPPMFDGVLEEQGLNPELGVACLVDDLET
jgi:hypothetical protein